MCSLDIVTDSVLDMVSTSLACNEFVQLKYFLFGGF